VQGEGVKGLRQKMSTEKGGGFDAPRFAKRSAHLRAGDEALVTQKLAELGCTWLR
jgi:hypothetical protein